MEQEESTGFHVLEVHMPTMGANIIVIIILILAALSCWRLRCCRSLFERGTSPRPRETPPSPSNYVHPGPPPTLFPQREAGAQDVLQALTLVAEGFRRPAVRLHHEDERRPHSRSRSPIFHDCRIRELSSPPTPARARAEDTEDKSVETPKSFF